MPRTQHPEITKFVDITEQLAGLMEQEVNYLRNNQRDELHTSYIRKEKLTSQYALQINLLRNQRHLYESLNEKEKERVVEALDRLKSSSELNAQVFQTTYETSEKLMLIMLEVAKQHNRNVDAYNHSGNMDVQNNKVYGYAPTPLAMDQRL